MPALFFGGVKKLLHLSFLLALGAVAAPAQSAPIAPAENGCDAYLKTPLPAEALSVPVQNAWPACDSIHAYSGIGRTVDYTAARQCAWRERKAQEKNLEPRFTPESLFGGAAMLAVLYANGDGVEQNKPLALRFACEASLNDDGLAAINALPAVPHVTEKRFQYCDYGYTTFEMNFCAAYQDEIAAQKRQDALDSLSSPWPQADKAAFAALEKQAESFTNAHGDYEIYRGGTIRTIRINSVEERQRDNFLAALRGFEAGKLPSGTATDYRQADSDLNETYRKALALAAQQNFAEDDGDIHPEDIQKAERAWIQYRDAWVAFARVHYPRTSQYAWLTLLTRNRYWSLRQTMCDVGWNDPACRPADSNR